MRKIRIGVMGCASIAQRLMIPAILNLPDKFELCAVASRTEEKAAHFATIFKTDPVVGYENLFSKSDIDAVYMPLPTGLHQEWVQKSLDAGKHVLVEKTLALDFEGARALVELARSKNLLLMENFMFRYHSQHQFVLQRLRNKDLGDIRLFRSQFGFPPLNKDNFRYSKQLGGGALLDAAAYTVRASQWFLGSEQKILAAALYMKDDCDIYGNVTLMSNKNIVSQLSFGFDNYYRCNYEFWGSKGVLMAEKAFTPKPGDSTNILFEQDGKTEIIAMKADNHFENILKEFYDSILKNRHEEHLNDILDQSRTLTDIQKKSIKIIV